uniref:Secreted ookinete protein n=1 Tax=Strongyloides papillosus TaxID=174720 RepID=A0A0N5CAT7_STREA
MKSIVILIIFLTSFCYLLICQNNYNENFNQPSGTIVCYNCTNVPIEDCETLCSGINCFINLKLPLLTSNIISFGCTLDLVDSGCINNNVTDDVTCYCNSNFCNYPEIVNISETDNSTFYEEEEATSMPSSLSIDYPTVKNPFILKNTSKRDVSEANNDFLQFIETLQFLDDFFDSFDNTTIKNETEPVDILDEDKILQMLNRLDYVLEKKMTNFFKSIEHNISSLPDKILKNSNNNLNKMKTQSFYDNVYGDYENSGTSSRSHLFSRLWKRISKLYFKESSEHLKHKNKKYYHINEEETTIFDIEDAVITYNYEINSFVLEIVDKNFDYKRIIIKKDYPPEDFSLLQSIIAFVASFGEKLGIVSGSIRKKLVGGLEISIQEQLNQTLTTANIAFKSYTEALFSKVLDVMTNFISKTQSRKKRSLTFQFEDKNSTTYVFQDQYHKIVNIYRKKRRVLNETSTTHNCEVKFPLYNTEISAFEYEILNKTQAYDKVLNNSYLSGEISMIAVLTEALLSPFPVFSPLPPEPGNFGSLETIESFSVINQNNSQLPNMSLTTIAKNNNSSIPNNNQSLSSIIVPNIINTTRLIPLKTIPNNTITESALNTNLTPMIMTISGGNVTSTMESITGTNRVTTITAYTTTDVITTTHSQTTVPMDVISTTTTKKVSTTTSSPGYFTSIYNYTLSLFGYGNFSLSSTIMAPLLTNDELPPDVIIGNNGQYTFTNGTIVSVSLLKEMLKKSEKVLYSTTIKSPDMINNIVLSITNSFHSFLTSFVNEFFTNFNGGNVTAIEKVKGFLESLTNKTIEVNSTVLPNENSTSAVSSLNMSTELSSGNLKLIKNYSNIFTNTIVISSYERKKRSLYNDLNIISDNIFSNSINASTNSSNIQRLEKSFKEILSNEKLSHVFIDYITKNVTLSEKEKSQLSRTIFQTLTSIMSNSGLQKFINQKLVEYSRENLFEDDYEETYTEKMEQLIKEMGKNNGENFNTILENILLVANNYNTVDAKYIEETMHSDGYQLGIKMGLAIKPILTNFDIMMKRIEKKKKKFVDCINDSYCFQDVLLNGL